MQPHTACLSRDMTTVGVAVLELAHIAHRASGGAGDQQTVRLERWRHTAWPVSR